MNDYDAKDAATYFTVPSRNFRRWPSEIHNNIISFKADIRTVQLSKRNQVHFVPRYRTRGNSPPRYLYEQFIRGAILF